MFPGNEVAICEKKPECPMMERVTLIAPNTCIRFVHFSWSNVAEYEEYFHDHACKASRQHSRQLAVAPPALDPHCIVMKPCDARGVHVEWIATAAVRYAICAS